ncbi:MAG: hypothetical protein LBI05_11740 [Planctomycetaceae bacterium]|jgi:hypothetical protein|nr:hypothetical protein [Planctomycetaceae bacterium]
MTKKTKTAELEVPETDSENEPTETSEKCENCGKHFCPEDGGRSLDDVPLCKECAEGLDAAETDTVEVDPNIQIAEQPPGLTPEEKIDAYERKEQVLREAQTELNSLEDQQAECRKEMNSFKKPISEARAKVERLISCDVSGFLRWEKEQELPLIQKAEEAANAWKSMHVSKLDVTAKDKEKLAEHFVTCGALADWLGKDFPDKKPGISGEKTKDRLRDAINKISGNLNP